MDTLTSRLCATPWLIHITDRGCGAYRWWCWCGVGRGAREFEDQSWVVVLFSRSGWYGEEVTRLARQQHSESTGRLKSTQLADIIDIMVRKNLAIYEPPKQTRAVVLYWRLPEEWAEVLHEWVRAPFPIPFLHLNQLFSTSPSPFVWSLSFSLSLSAGDENRTGEHDTDVLRDYESTRAVCALWSSRVASTQCDIDTRQGRPGPAH